VVHRQAGHPNKPCGNRVAISMPKEMAFRAMLPLANRISPAVSPSVSPERRSRLLSVEMSAGTQHPIGSRRTSEAFQVYPVPDPSGIRVLPEDEYHRAVLISHSRRDPAALNAVYALISALRAHTDPSTGQPFSRHCHRDSRRVELWCDKEQLADKGGHEWGKPILRALRKGVAAIFFVGNAFCSSEPCRKELAFATSKGQIRIPVFLQWLCRSEEDFNVWLASKAEIPGGVISSPQLQSFDQWRECADSVEFDISLLQGVPAEHFPTGLEELHCDACRRCRDKPCPTCSDWNLIVRRAGCSGLIAAARQLGRYIDAVVFEKLRAVDAVPDPASSTRSPALLADQVPSTDRGGKRKAPEDEKSHAFAEFTDFIKLGEGAFGAVYTATWSSAGCQVALKAAKTGADDLAFSREISFNLSARHPNIVQCLGLTSGVLPGHTEEQDMIVMEYMPGADLSCFISNHAHLHISELQQRVSIAADIVAAMIYMHQHKKLAHLDLKSPNIMMDSGRAKIGDFGFGPRTGAWQAPEQVESPTHESAFKADVYSFGVVLWELAHGTGETLMASWESAAGLAGKLEEQAVIPRWASQGIRPPIAAACEPRWRELIEDCWDTDPELRFSFRQIQKKYFPLDAAKRSKVWGILLESETTNVQLRYEGNLLDQSSDHSPDDIECAVSASSDHSQAMVNKVKEAVMDELATCVQRVHIQQSPCGDPSETKVVQWLRSIGLARVAHQAASHKKYCEMQSFESMDSAANIGQCVQDLGLKGDEISRFREGLHVLALDARPLTVDVRLSVQVPFDEVSPSEEHWLTDDAQYVPELESSGAVDRSLALDDRPAAYHGLSSETILPGAGAAMHVGGDDHQDVEPVGGDDQDEGTASAFSIEQMRPSSVGLARATRLLQLYKRVRQTMMQHVTSDNIEVGVSSGSVIVNIKGLPHWAAVAVASMMAQSNQSNLPDRLAAIMESSAAVKLDPGKVNCPIVTLGGNPVARVLDCPQLAWTDLKLEDSRSASTTTDRLKKMDCIDEVSDDEVSDDEVPDTLQSDLDSIGSLESLGSLGSPNFHLPMYHLATSCHIGLHRQDSESNTTKEQEQEQQQQHVGAYTATGPLRVNIQGKLQNPPADEREERAAFQEFAALAAMAAAENRHVAAVIQRATGFRVHAGAFPSPAQSVTAADMQQLLTELDKLDDYVSVEEREQQVQVLLASMKAFKFRMHQPYEPRPVETMARTHEQKEYQRAKLRNPDNRADQKKAYLGYIARTCKIMDQAQPPSNTAPSGGSARVQQNEPYWRLLDRMRPYKHFVLKYVNGPLNKWKHESEAALAVPGVEPAQRQRHEKHIEICKAITKMFLRLYHLCDDTPEKFKYPCAQATPFVPICVFPEARALHRLVVSTLLLNGDELCTAVNM
jgi:serine/threonine protein kinase